MVLRLERDGWPVALNLRKALGLLGYLALPGQPQRRDKLVARLKATIVVSAGWSKRRELPDGRVCSVDSSIKHNPDVGLIAVPPE